MIDELIAGYLAPEQLAVMVDDLLQDDPDWTFAEMVEELTANIELLLSDDGVEIDFPDLRALVEPALSALNITAIK